MTIEIKMIILKDVKSRNIHLFQERLCNCYAISPTVCSHGVYMRMGQPWFALCILEESPGAAENACGIQEHPSQAAEPSASICSYVLRLPSSTLGSSADL